VHQFTGGNSFGLFIGPELIQKDAEVSQGQIFPIGSEPNGKQWTGFQLVLNDKEGYVLVFREDNKTQKPEMNTWLPTGKTVSFISISGPGKSFEFLAKENGMISFDLKDKNSFGFYSCQIKS